MDSDNKRIMVDMSITLIHHGHIRILKEAKKLGTVVVALTVDKEVEKAKGYLPELTFDQRKEILEAIRYVDEVVPCNWLIDEAYLDSHNIDLLVHGSDNMNKIDPNRLLILPRTDGISTTLLRAKVLQSVAQIFINGEKS